MIFNASITQSGGGGGTPWPGEYVSTEYSKTYKFSETGFATWTPSTSATSIVAAPSAFVVNIYPRNYDYTILLICTTNYVYITGVTPKKCLKKQVTIYKSTISCYPQNTSDAQQGIYSYAGVIGQYNAGSNYYYSSGGSNTYTNAALSYGVYNYSTPSISLTNPAVDTTKMNITLSAIYARCNTTYFDVSMAPNVDQDASTITRVVKIYRSALFDTEGGAMRKMALELLNE